MDNHMLHRPNALDLTQSPDYSFINQNFQEPSNNPTPNHPPATSILPESMNFALEENQEEDELGYVKEMRFKTFAMQPVDIDPATICRPKRRNMRISDNPQTVAARQRRERIGEKMRILQRLVPDGNKMDTASMLDEAAKYVKFLQRQIHLLQGQDHHQPPGGSLRGDEVRRPDRVTSEVSGGEPSYMFGGNGSGSGEDEYMFYNPRYFP